MHRLQHHYWSFFIVVLSVCGVHGQETGAELANGPIGLGESAAASNQWPQAEQYYRTAIAADPTKTAAYVGLGRSLNHQGRFTEAITNLERSLTWSPQDPNAFFYLGYSYFEVSDYPRAITNLQQYVSLESTNASAYYWLSRSFHQMGQLTNAEIASRKAIALNPSKLIYLNRLGGCLLDLHRYSEAIQIFRQTLSLEATNTRALCELGEGYYYLKDYTNAAEWIQKYVSQGSTNPYAFHLLSHSLSELGQYTNALIASQRAVMLAPSNVYYLNRLGSCQDDVEQYEAALQTFKRALQLDPTNAYGYLGLGYVRYSLKDYTNSIVALQKCIALNPGDEDGYYWLGSSCFELQRYSEAGEAFKRALKLRPEDSRANFWCGQSLVRLGSLQKGLWYLARAREIERAKQKGRLDLFLLLAYLLTGQFDKAYGSFPIASIISVGGVTLSYVFGLLWWLRRSFRIQPQRFPGLGFSLVWLILFIEGAAVCTLFQGLLFRMESVENLLGPLSLAGLPIIMATVGFARQPWGRPFTWPPPLPSVRIIGRLVLLFIVMLVSIAVLEASFTYIFHHPIPEQETKPIFKVGINTHPLSAILYVVIIGPITEEILFRGLVFGSLEKRLSLIWTIPLSSFLFAAIHFQVTGFIYLFGFGMLLGWARWKSGSIGLPIVVHALNNGIVLVALKHAADNG